MGTTWKKFTLTKNSASKLSALTAVSRIPNSMEVWWIGLSGSVEAAFWYEGDQWKRYQLAPTGSAASDGGIAAVSRIPNSMEVWWVSSSGSVEAAFWYEGDQWKRYQLAPTGSAAPGSDIAVVSRIPNSMEVWWVSSSGSVEAAFWYEGDQWKRYQLAPAGSAASGSDIAVVSRIPNSMEVWWAGPSGSVEAAFWYEGDQWKRYQLAPAGSAAPGSDIAVVSRIPNSMEVWWSSPSGSVEAAFWYEGDQWKRYQLASASSAATGNGIAAVSRIPSSMEVWWITDSGAVEDAFFYEKVATFTGSIKSGGLAALGGWAEVTIHGDGISRWRGHAHDSGLDGYDFGVTALLKSTNGRVLAFAHSGHVGGTFTSGSRDHDWNEQAIANAIISANFAEFSQGQYEVQTQYSSDIGSIAESTLSIVARWLIGSNPVGTVAGLIVFVGVEVGSLISTGSLVPGARVVEGVLWLAGPSNTLLALAAEGIAAAGSRTRELTQEEYDWANTEVFSGTLPSRDRILLTDTIGGGNRAFTFPRYDGKITLNMGPDALDDPRDYGTANGRRVRGEVFIHELVHAWQISHTPMDLALLADAFASKICEANGDNPYTYGIAGSAYKDFNLEQQAEIVSDWFAGRRKPNTNQTGKPKDEESPYFTYVLNNIRTGQY